MTQRLARSPKPDAIKSARDAINELLPLTKDASARTRYVLVAMISTAVILFLAAWKQTSFAWLYVRYESRNQAVVYLEEQNRETNLSTEAAACEVMAENLRILQGNCVTIPKTLINYKIFLVKRTGSCKKITPEAFNELWNSHLSTPSSASQPGNSVGQPSCPDLNSTSLGISALYNELVKDAQELRAESIGIKADLGSEKYKAARALVDEWRPHFPNSNLLEKAKREQSLANELFKGEMTVHLPLLNVDFHINDTGIIAGFLLFVLLIWMRYSLADEVEGLQKINNELHKTICEPSKTEKPEQEEAENEKTKEEKTNQENTDLYRLTSQTIARISLQQLFILVPNMKKSTQQSQLEEFPVINTKATFAMLLALPIVCELALFLADWHSNPAVGAENPVGYRSTLVVSAAFFALNLMMTLRIWSDFKRLQNNLNKLIALKSKQQI